MSVLDQTKLHHKFFEEMTKIPHGSYNEKPYSDYLVDWAAQRNLKCIQDEMWNVIIYKEASPGYEDHAPVMLQGHMDMVCAKAKDSDHDFTKDPLELYIEDGWLRAKGTTLGADDGVGCAYMLAILEDDSLPHPPLECVFTVQEEVGCNGAAFLKPEYFQAKRMLGLDDVGGGTSYVTAAGGQCTRFVHAVEWEQNELNGYELKVSGLLSGHSGIDIEKELANALKLAAVTLYKLMQKGELRLASADMGSANNVIASDGTVLFASALDEGEVQAIVGECCREYRNMYQWSDPNVMITVQAAEVESVITAKDSEEILKFVRFIPDGFMHKSMKFQDLTTVSSNIGVWKLAEDRGSMYFEANSRSAMEFFIDLMVEEQTELCRIYNFVPEYTGRVAGFDYIPESEMRTQVDKALLEVTGKNLEELYIHGGIEAGYLVKMIPGIDICTIGPLAPDEHTINEKLNMQSFDDIYAVICKTLEVL